jgi:hypothetical protein
MTMTCAQERAAKQSADPHIRGLSEAYGAAGAAFGEAAAHLSHVIWQAVELRRQGKTREADAMQPDVQAAIDRKITLQEAVDASWEALARAVGDA